MEAAIVEPPPLATRRSTLDIDHADFEWLKAYLQRSSSDVEAAAAPASPAKVVSMSGHKRAESPPRACMSPRLAGDDRGEPRRAHTLIGCRARRAHTLCDTAATVESARAERRHAEARRETRA